MWFQNALRLSGLTLFLGAFFTAIPQSSQAQPPRPLLTFNLVALDAKGRPLRELPASDLRIYDDGKLMQAAFCRPLVTAERKLAPLGPREYSNRPTGGSVQSILILLDLLNANLAERGQGWNDIASTFQKLESGEYLYLYLLTKEATIYPVHALPDIENPAPSSDTDWVAQIPSLLDQAMHKVDRLRPQDLQADVHIRVSKTLEVLRDLASDFAVQPGRKSLVWVSHGVPIAATGLDGYWRDYTSAVTRLGTDFARSGIAVYAVEQEERETSGLSSATTMQELAGLTAGQYFTSNATGKTIELAAREGRATYQVGYVPPLDRWDDKFHKLRVTTGNKDARLRTIEGYFGDVREADPRQRLALATFGLADDSGIGIRAAVTPSAKGNGWSHFQIRVDAADLQLTPGATYTGEFRVTLAYYTTEWEHEVWQDSPTQFHFTPADRDTIMRNGLDLSSDRPVPAGVHKVRIVVRDEKSGVVGSLTVPVASP